MTLYNEQIIAWLRPFANKLKEYVPSPPFVTFACGVLSCRWGRLPGGWAIPIGIMFVISFPPYVQRVRVKGSHYSSSCADAAAGA